jgi:transposase
MNDVAELQKENVLLRENITQRDAQLQRSDVKIKALEEKLRLILAQTFASSSEKVSPDQRGLFNEAEDEVAQCLDAEDKDTTIVASHTRSQKPRVSIPDDLPREDIVHDIPEADKVCPHDGHTLELIGSDDHEQLDIIPAQIKVLRHRRLKYACPCCDQHIVTASKPNQPIEKSIASAGLLAFVATQKYCDALPLYRQTEMFKRIGIELNRTNLANWMIKVGELVQPLLEHYIAHLQQQNILHMDETTLQVLDEPGKTAQSKSYMWLMASFDLHPIVAYHYSPSRSRDIPLGLLSDKTQALMIDGYNGYQPACERYAIERLGCWAHARRKFIDAQKALTKGKAGKADQAIAFIQALYRIEAKIKDDPPDKRRAIRQQEAKPIIEKIKVWLDKSMIHMLPSSKMGEALTYLQNQWARLTAYLENGAYPIDNNPAERAIRPFTIGRKNWMFAKSQAGAKASANLYSLIETAKANNVNPYHYLKHVFSRLPNMTTKDDMNELMPWRFENS